MNTSPRSRYRVLAFLSLTAAWSLAQAQDGVRLGASFYRYREDAGKAVVTVLSRPSVLADPLELGEILARWKELKPSSIVNERNERNSYEY